MFLKRLWSPSRILIVEVKYKFQPCIVTLSLGGRGGSIYARCTFFAGRCLEGLDCLGEEPGGDWI